MTPGKESAAPRFSVVVPIYNVAGYLEACVRSVLQQQAVTLEIILVDDGSTDTSGEIADRLAAEHPNIRVLHQENGGQDSARKAGLPLCTGDYIVFLDSDDTLAPGSLQLADEKLRAGGDGVDVLQMDYLYAYDDGTSRPMGGLEKVFRGKETITGVEYCVNEFRYHNGFWNLWSRVYRRTFLQRLTLPKLEKYVIEDFLFIFHWCFEDCEVGYCDAPLVAYRAVRAGSDTASYGVGSRFIYGHLVALKLALDEMDAHRAAFEPEDYAYLVSMFARLYVEYYLKIFDLPAAQRKDLLWEHKALDGRTILRRIEARDRRRYPAARLWLHRRLAPRAAHAASQAVRVWLECWYSAIYRLTGRRINEEETDTAEPESTGPGTGA